MWVVFNKQDLLPTEQACDMLAEHRKKFEMELLAHAPTVKWQFVDLPGFSAMTGNRCSELLDVMHDTISQGPTKSTSSASSAAISRRQKKLADIPSEADLVARIEQERNNDLTGDDFWSAFLSGQIAQWNHRSHLRAGYVLLLDSLMANQGLLECAEVFLEHLQRLKGVAPDRFRNTEHRTMTIFWLYNVRLAILNFKSDKHLDELPGQDMFDEVLLHSPYLMYGGLWKEWYTKDLMMSPEAKQYWRLPDLQALPDFAEKTETQKRHVRRLSQEEPFRLIRFAFAVVQRYMSSDIRRGWLIKQSMAALQQTTMRARAQNPDMRPYSETQAYFWIQIIHAALAGADDMTSKITLGPKSIHQMDFSSFRTLFDIDPSLWRAYYKPTTWDSVEARSAFISPDLQQLPSIISMPHPRNAELAIDRRMPIPRIEMAAEIPSMEELALRSTILLDELSRTDVTTLKSVDIVSHAHMLHYLYDRLTMDDAASTETITSRATSAMMDMQGIFANCLTLKAFWTQQMLVASSTGREKSTFGDVIRANMHLVFEDLPSCYYSPELLQSMDARQRIVAPDRRKFKAFLPVDHSPELEKDWVIM